jgi:hypothetical protein
VVHRFLARAITGTGANRNTGTTGTATRASHGGTTLA